MATYTLSKEFSASVGGGQTQKAWNDLDVVVDITVGSSESEYSQTLEYYCETESDETSLRSTFDADSDGTRYSASFVPDGGTRVSYAKSVSPPTNPSGGVVTAYAISKEYSVSRGTAQGIKTLSGTVIYPTTAADEKTETWEFAADTGAEAENAFNAALGCNKAVLTNTDATFSNVTDGTENLVRLSGTDQPGLSRFSVTIRV